MEEGSTTLPCKTQHSTAQHSAAQHSAAQHTRRETNEAARVRTSSRSSQSMFANSCSRLLSDGGIALPLPALPALPLPAASSSEPKKAVESASPTPSFTSRSQEAKCACLPAFSSHMWFCSPSSACFCAHLNRCGSLATGRERRPQLTAQTHAAQRTAMLAAAGAQWMPLQLRFHRVRLGCLAYKLRLALFELRSSSLHNKLTCLCTHCRTFAHTRTLGWVHALAVRAALE